LAAGSGHYNRLGSRPPPPVEVTNAETEENGRSLFVGRVSPLCLAVPEQHGRRRAGAELSICARAVQQQQQQTVSGEWTLGRCTSLVRSAPSVHRICADNSAYRESLHGRIRRYGRSAAGAFERRRRVRAPVISVLSTNASYVRAYP